jgi:hypothetical protein
VRFVSTHGEYEAPATCFHCETAATRARQAEAQGPPTGFLSSYHRITQVD